MAISKRSLASSIDRAHDYVASAWSAIRPASTQELQNRGHELVGSQVKLIEALWLLDAQYRAIGQEKRRLIANKSRYSPAWFAGRMAKLDAYLQILKGEIGAAKVVGDGYAWIFYRNDPNLIDQHLRKQRQINLPPGVGGIGERAFVERMQGINGHFVLYHGITSYLRLGDVTFVDLANRRVKSIGELKSEKVGDSEYRVTLGFIYGPEVGGPIDMEDTAHATHEGTPAERRSVLSQIAETRLRRQLSEIEDALSRSKEADLNPVVSTNGVFHFSELNQVIEDSRKSGSAFGKAGNSLVLGAVRVSGSRASDRALREPGQFRKKIAPALRAARSICDKDLNDNCLSVGTVGFGADGFPTVLPGTVPLFWWPLSPENLFDLTFGRVVILTIYNPAHLWQGLRNMGFTIETKGQLGDVKAWKRFSGRVLELQNLDYFRLLTENFLMSDDAVLNLISKSTEIAQRQEETPFRLNLAPRMKL